MTMQLAVRAGVVTFGGAIASILKRVLTKKAVVGAGATLGVAEVVDIVQDMFGDSDPPAKDELVASVMRIVEETLWPTRRDGNKIVPKYYVLNLDMGNAWFTQQYYSKNSVDAAFKRGVEAGKRRDTKERALEAQIERGN